METIYQEIRIALHAVWRMRWLALAIAWAVCAVGWFAVSRIPNTYESRARISVQIRSMLGGQVGIDESDRQKDLDRVRQTLISNESLKKVVRESDLGTRPLSDAEMAAVVDMLRGNITITTQQDDLIEIKARVTMAKMHNAEVAHLAKSVVQNLVARFVDENLAGDRDQNSQTLTFLDAELQRRAKQLQDAEQRKAEFEQRVGVLPGVGSIEQRMEASRVELTNVNTNLISAQSSLSAMSAQMAGTAATLGSSGDAPGSARARISALEDQLAEANARGWTDQHPDVVAINRQLVRLRAQAGRGGGGSGATANPMYVTLRSMQAERQGTVAALTARKNQLEADMARFAGAMASQPDAQADQARLERDYDVLKTQYDKLLADRESVRLRSDASSKTNAIRFSVIDKPSVPSAPVAPNRPMLLGLVLLAGLGAGAGVAFARSQLAATFATTQQLAKASGLPVLGAISYVVTEAGRIEERRNLRRFAMAAAGLPIGFAALLAFDILQRTLAA